MNWLLRQLRDAPAGTRLEVSFPNARDTTSAMVEEALEDHTRLLYPSDPRREPKAFRIALAKEMGRKRGSGDDSFVRETSRQVVGFYGDLVQGLRRWTASAPKLKPQEDGEAVGEFPGEGSPSAGGFAD